MPIKLLLDQGKYTLKIKIANRLHILTAQAFIFCFDCGAISTLAPNTRVAIFPAKHVSFLQHYYFDAIFYD